jgi:phosphonopyruvate decarboxylase
MMIDTKEFYIELINNKIDFFTGVPDSLLKDICAYISDHTPKERNIISANEGGAVALGVGYHLATNNIPLIYMQNSGIGNAINPLLSLADKEVYSIPMILLIGWRGEPGIKDEPQHIKQGRVTISMLESMEIPYTILDETSDFKDIIKISVKNCRKYQTPVAIIVRKNTFSPYLLVNNPPDKYELSREAALALVLSNIPNNCLIISTTGMLSRELFELREKNKQNHHNDFLTVGSMGHASQIALGIAIAKPNKKVFCFDGDGAALMHLGNYSIIGELAPKNLKIILFNNGAHDSVGGQPTIGHSITLTKTAESFNIKTLGNVSTIDEISKGVRKLVKSEVLSFIDIRIKKGARKDLGRPTITPIENKNNFKSNMSI